MGKIKDFFNKMFGKKPKALGSVSKYLPSNRDILHGEEEKTDTPDFKEDLQKNTIQKYEMSFDETLDYFIQNQELETICENPRGREEIGKMLKSFFQAKKIVDKDGVYNRADIARNIEKNFCKEARTNRNYITFTDYNSYSSDDYRHNRNIAPGLVRTRISKDEYGNLEVCRQSRGEYLYEENPYEKSISGDKKTPKVYYSELRRKYDKSGLESESTRESCRYDKWERTISCRATYPFSRFCKSYFGDD